MYLLNEKTEFIPYSEIKCPKSGILLIIIEWGESGKVIIIVYYAREAATINTNYTMNIYKKHLHNKMQY